MVAYNLELFGGRLHTDLWFALAWGAFPALTAYYAQAETIKVAGVLVAAACMLFTAVQRFAMVWQQSSSRPEAERRFARWRAWRTAHGYGDVDLGRGWRRRAAAAADRERRAEREAARAAARERRAVRRRARTRP